MIRIAQQPEPDGFHEKVREKGNRWLMTQGIPPDRHCSQEFWNNRHYWTSMWDEFCIAYDGICAYTCLPVNQGGSIDHFKEKADHPSLAFEWSNYRLAAFRINSKKKSHHATLDPFQIPDETFFLNLMSGEIYPNPEIDPDILQLAISTRDSLTLDSPAMRYLRLQWISDYFEKKVMAVTIQRKAPFIHSELKRQGLL